MNYQIKLFITYQNERNDLTFNNLVTALLPLLNEYIKKVPYIYQEDMYQELLMLLYKAINRFIIRKYPINEKQFSKINFEKIRNHNYQELGSILNSNYLNSFIKKYGDDLLLKALESKEVRNQFVEEYSLFCNEKQFIAYINKVFETTIINEVFGADNLLQVPQTDTIYLKICRFVVTAAA